MREAKALERYSRGERTYKTDHPIYKSVILVGCPDAGRLGNFGSFLEDFIEAIPESTLRPDLNLVEISYKEGRGTIWKNDVPLTTKPLWENSRGAIIGHEVPMEELSKHFAYDLKPHEPYSFNYLDKKLGPRIFYGILDELHGKEEYLILNSRGIRRRLNFARIGGFMKLDPGWSARRKYLEKVGFSMVYVALKFEDVEPGLRRISWNLLPNDRSATLLEVLGGEEPDENPLQIQSFDDPREATVEEEPKQLKSWTRFLESSVKVTLSKADGLENHYLVLDHLSWEPEAKLVTVGSKGLRLYGSAEDFTLERLE